MNMYFGHSFIIHKPAKKLFKCAGHLSHGSLQWSRVPCWMSLSLETENCKGEVGQVPHMRGVLGWEVLHLDAGSCSCCGS
jgi:hypothetical protein